MTLRNPTPYDCGIYAITSPSGKKYIGSSNNIPKRWHSHKRDLIRNRHHSPHLQHAWNKYNGQLEFSVLLVCRVEDLQMYEQQYLDFYKPEYNISPTAYSCRGIKRTEEFKKKVSEFQKGNKWSLGVYPSAETRAKLSAALIGNTRARGLKGYVPSEEHRRKISSTLMGHIHSEETRRKIGEKSREMWARRKAEKLACLD